MRTAVLPLVLLVALAGEAWAQSLYRGDGSPYDPPAEPALKKHDHVQIEFQLRGAPAAEPDSRLKGELELRQWVRSEGKDASITAGVITAEVVDVRPNGTLVLQAVQRRTWKGAQETMRLLAEIALRSVKGGKASYEHLVNVSVVYDGTEDAGARSGLLGWIFGKLWPF
jgi:hypothetical protein